MARTVREELIGVRLAVDRYFMEQEKEPNKLGYPTHSAEQGLAVKSTAPTPEDPELDRIGWFIFRLTKVKRDILKSSVQSLDQRTAYLKARGFGISLGSYNRKIDGMLRELKGHMLEFYEMRKAA